MKMACDSFIWRLLMFGCIIQALTAVSEDDPLEYMSKQEREALKEEARDMFYHAYNAYMDNAYPADELMPLSCKGRYRGSEPNRGDIDSTLGNFSLTLVDTLDTLVVLGDLGEFENAVKLVTRDVSFDTDVIVSLFETNIRMLGGLLSGHILAEYLQQRADIMPWYKGELLDLAKDLGFRFLPAFNTTTGIPYGRINLKYGMKGVPMEVSRETCTACAGSMILEMAALSRLTGESIFEEKAQKAMDVLWRMRHRGTDLMGSVLNVHSGDWVRRDSGVGAGIDSYYEYCLKAYILLGDEKYLGRFNKHYQAIMKYVSQGPMLLDVHMHRPNTNAKNFMDALLAFWPGLQVLKGDIKPAVETHEMLYQVMQRHNFIPEAFTTDFQVHWGHHPLRPEFLESTYFLYRATGDHYYLGVGRKVLRSLQTYARVSCGYAAVSDVRTNKHDDTMDSFVLSETFKYLFLLFAEANELVLDLDEFIFTTEGHLLPLTLASVRTNISSEFERDIVQVDEFDRTCPNSLHLFPASVRQPLRNMVEDVCPRRSIKRRLSASQFQANNLEHLKMLSDMGITTLTLADGRVQLLHTFSNAKTPQDSEEGLLFMQEMVELSKIQSQQAETKPQAVTFMKPQKVVHVPQKVTLLAGPAHFGPQLSGLNKVVGKIVFAYPHAACTDLLNPEKLTGKIVIMDRGNCMFIEKARRIQKAGAVAGIVIDNVVGSSAATSPMFAMSGDGKEVDDVTIPVVFLFSAEATELMKAIGASNGDLTVTIGDVLLKEEVQLKAPTDLSVFERLKGSLKSFLSQQTTTQQTGNTGMYMDAIPKIELQENQVDTVDFYHLHAEIVKDSLGGEVRITASSSVPSHMIKKPEESTPLEKQWRQLKEVFVNEIYANSKQKMGFQIRVFMLISYYNWILKERSYTNDINLLNEMPLTLKVLWFLKELSEIAPNPSIMKMEHLMDLNKRKLLKQHLLSKMDIILLKLKDIATMRNKLVSIKPEMEHLLKIPESGIMLIKNYSFLRHLLQEIIDEEDESIRQHIALLDHIHSIVHDSYPEVLIYRLQKNLEKPESETSYYDNLINDLQNNWQKLGEKVNLLKKTGEEDLPVAELIADSNESKTPINAKELFKKRKNNKDVPNEKYEDFEHFILLEIEKVVKKSRQNIFQKNNEASDAKNTIITVDEKAEISRPENKIIIQATYENQSDSLNSEVKESVTDDDSANMHTSESFDTIIDNKPTTENMVDDKLLETSEKKYQVPEIIMTVDSSTVDTISNNKNQPLLQDVQKEAQGTCKYNENHEHLSQESSIDSKVKACGLVSDSKNPVRTSDVIKEKHLSDLKKNSQVSSNTKLGSKEQLLLEYNEEYMVNLDINNGVAPKDESRHIDEL